MRIIKNNPIFNTVLDRFNTRLHEAIEYNKKKSGYLQENILSTMVGGVEVLLKNTS